LAVREIEQDFVVDVIVHKTDFFTAEAAQDFIDLRSGSFGARGRIRKAAQSEGRHDLETDHEAGE
jgi:hypothetical protein